MFTNFLGENVKKFLAFYNLASKSPTGYKSTSSLRIQHLRTSCMAAAFANCSCQLLDNGCPWLAFVKIITTLALTLRRWYHALCPGRTDGNGLWNFRRLIKINIIFLIVHFRAWIWLWARWIKLKYHTSVFTSTDLCRSYVYKIPYV